VDTSFETLLYEEDEGVATVTLNRPEVHNSFDLRMERELKRLWTGLRWNDDVRVVILTGAGEKAFCTGIDRQESIEEGYLGNKKNRDPDRAGPLSTPFMYNDPGVFINPKQNDMWKPVVAAVNGMACGGALYLLGESDIIIAAEHATFFDPHVTYGMVAGFESFHLLQKLPLGETMRLALLGRPSAPDGAGLRGRPRGRADGAGHVGGARDRVRARARHSGDGPCDLDGPRAVPARGAGAGLELRVAGYAIRQHRRGSGHIPRRTDRVAAALSRGGSRLQG